jgi:cytidine deaminase|tara:strand:- start:390 stop:932 length:543 start_codon:yes stop_codon:yes gene_type:complete
VGREGGQPPSWQATIPPEFVWQNEAWHFSAFGIATLAKGFYSFVKLGGIMTSDLRQHASAVQENAYAPYSNFKVGAALRTASGAVFVGCNVENVAYPEGTCAEAGAIAAMIAAGETAFVEAYVIAGSPTPVTPCGGCRQKLAEFGQGDARVTMATLSGVEEVMTMAELLPGAFGRAHMEG